MNHLIQIHVDSNQTVEQMNENSRINVKIADKTLSVTLK